MTLLDTALAMDPGTIAAFMGAAVILYLTPGVDMMFIIASGVNGGPRAGVAAAFGISLGVFIHALVAAIGVASLLAANPALFDAIRYAGAAYLAWLAITTWRSAGRTTGTTGQSRLPRAFARGLLTNLLNPKVALFALALLPQFASPAIGPVWHQIVILGALLALGGALFTSVYGLAAGHLAQRLTRASRTMNRLSALLFGGLAARLAFD